MKKYNFLVFLSLLFISCTSTYKYDFSELKDTKLEKQKSIAITVSEEGTYSNDVYSGSGRILSNIIKKTVKQYSDNVIILKRYEFIDDFSEEELVKYDYIIVPEILHWEDRATAWNALPDKIEINIEIYNSNKELIKSTSFYGESKKMTLSSNDPSELLEEPLTELFKVLFDETD